MYNKNNMFFIFLFPLRENTVQIQSNMKLKKNTTVCFLLCVFISLVASAFMSGGIQQHNSSCRYISQICPSMPFLSLLPFYRSPQSPGEQNNLFSTGRLGRDGHA